MSLLNFLGSKHCAPGCDIITLFESKRELQLEGLAAGTLNDDEDNVQGKAPASTPASLRAKTEAGGQVRPVCGHVRVRGALGLW